MFNLKNVKWSEILVTKKVEGKKIVEFDREEINFHTLVSNSTDKKYYNKYNNKCKKYNP